MKYIIYKAYYKNAKSKFSHFIRLQQRMQGIPEPFCGYSHEEIVFGYVDDLEVLRLIRGVKELYGDSNMNTPVLKREDYFKVRSLWFSSSESDGGCRLKFIQDNKENWDFFQMEVTREEYIGMLKYAISLDEYSYGWTKIFFTQAIKTLWFVKRKTYFCSEISVILVQIFLRMFKGENSIEFNPGKSAWYIDKYHQDKGQWVKSIS